MIRYIWMDIQSACGLLPWCITVGATIGIFAFAIYMAKWKEKGKKSALFAFVAFFIYVAIIVSLTLLGRKSGSRVGVDLIPFSTWGNNDRNHAYVVENVLLFIPFGLLGGVCFLKMRKLFGCILAGLFASLLIEVIQLATGRGYFQVDDILANTCGCVLGVLLFQLLDAIFNRRKRN